MSKLRYEHILKHYFLSFKMNGSVLLECGLPLPHSKEFQSQKNL